MIAPPSRRQILAQAAGLGLSVTLLAHQAQAAIQGRKFITVVCRGGLDGLSLTPPVGDADYRRLRGALTISDALPLDGTFGLNPALPAIHAMIQAGHGRIVPAIATPDRARSHFEAQDVLESGAAAVYGASSGWLNRTLTALSRQGKVEALSVGPTAPLILRGPAPASSWSPGRTIEATARLPTLLQDLYQDDPILGPALARGLATETMAMEAMSGLSDPSQGSPMGAYAGGGVQGLQRQGQEAARNLGGTLAGFMRAPGGPQIAALSLDGFDTHANQTGQLANRLAGLDSLMDGLRTGLGPDWDRTVVVVMTEFGRTARPNGTGGTDHGTASSALLLGGGLKRGGIIGDWPGLKDNALFEGRDLAPSLDMRGLLKGVLAGQLGVETRDLDTAVFPDSTSIRAVPGLV
jgi:uncharacterized protein (DUF1501 family)